MELDPTQSHKRSDTMLLYYLPVLETFSSVWPAVVLWLVRMTSWLPAAFALSETAGNRSTRRVIVDVKQSGMYYTAHTSLGGPVLRRRSIVS